MIEEAMRVCFSKLEPKISILCLEKQSQVSVKVLTILKSWSFASRYCFTSKTELKFKIKSAVKKKKTKKDKKKRIENCEN